MLVELSTSKTEIRGDAGNNHQKLGLKRISCESQLTMRDMLDSSLNPAGNNTDTRLSTPNQASCTPDFTYPLVSSISFWSSSPSLFLVHNSTIITRTQSLVIPLYLSMPSSWHLQKCKLTIDCAMRTRAAQSKLPVDPCTTRSHSHL